MDTQEFRVANVKCGGCADTIKSGLAGLAGVAGVEVALGEGRVTVHGEGLARDVIAARLAELGYPERN